MENGSCKDCRAHSGIVHDIFHLQETTKNQQREIDGMKRWLIATLTSSVFSLVGVLVLLAIAYAKTL
ncbi:MAG: hypothetical protein JRF25_00525 [Deltaproteobacteria bacterium]|nr:hypothetical protein [Deltaproteobacteria bacterium]